jgi:hypothetical protein
MGKSTNLMAIFNSDVGFPEGREEKRSMSLDKHGKRHVRIWQGQFGRG